MRKKKKFYLFDFCNYVFMILVLVVVLYPLYFTIIASLSQPMEVAAGNISLWPRGFTLEAYEYLMDYRAIWQSYGNSIYYTVLGTLWALFLTIPTAYVLSKPKFPHKGFYVIFFMIPMFFNGGLVPDYLLIKKLGLLDTRAVLILIGGFSAYNLIVSRTYFQTTIPEELYESAEIDGASEFKKFMAIALPLSKSIMAVMALFYAVTKWNNYFEAMIYVSNEDYAPLQLILRRALLFSQTSPSVRRQQMAYTMKYAMVFIGSLPLMLSY